jgi:hypothetical protein
MMDAGKNSFFPLHFARRNNFNSLKELITYAPGRVNISLDDGPPTKNLLFPGIFREKNAKKHKIKNNCL